MSMNLPDDVTIEQRLGELTTTIEDATTERASLLRLAAAKHPEGHPDRWTQTRLAAAARITQQAVSKTLKGTTGDSEGWRYGVLLRAMRDVAEAVGERDAWDKMESIAIPSPPAMRTVRPRVKAWLARLERTGHPQVEELRERVDVAEAGLLELPGYLSIKQQSDAILGYHARREADA